MIWFVLKLKHGFRLATSWLLSRQYEYCLTTSYHLGHCPIAEGYFQDHEYELLFEAAGPALLGSTLECWIFLMSRQMMTRCRVMSQLGVVFHFFVQVGEMLFLIIQKHFVTVYTCCWWCSHVDVNLAPSDKRLSRSSPFNLFICPSEVIMPKWWSCLFLGWSSVEKESLSNFHILTQILTPCFAFPLLLGRVGSRRKDVCN